MPLTTVAVILTEHPDVFGLGVAHEVFGVDRTDDGVPAFDYRVCSERPGEPLEADNGLLISAPHGLDAARDADLVIATSYNPGPRLRGTASEPLRRAFVDARARGAWVLSMCTGAFLLGEAGLLDGRTCTTHWRHAAALTAAYPRASVDPDVLFVEDTGVVTSAGTAAAIDACLHLVRHELGAAVANRIARRMVMPPQREGGQRQFIDLPVPECSADSLTPVLLWMREHLAEELPVAALAQRAAMSERTFARRFAAETGTTPGKWLLAQRLHRARQLLEGTDLPVDSVAVQSGFGSAALLRHHFGARVGVAPAEYRRTFRTPDRPSVATATTH